MRVLLPGLDRARGAYGVKERRLADLYIRILGLRKDGNDAQKLINFRYVCVCVHVCVYVCVCTCVCVRVCDTNKYINLMIR